MILILFAGLLSYTNPVKALGTPQIVGINPSSPAPVGTNVSIHATVQWDSDFRSMRICFRDENWCQEEGTPDFTKNFDTSGLSAGTYTIIVEVAAVDKGWDTANKTYGSYELTGSSQPPTPVPPATPPKGPNISIFDFSPSSANVGDQVTIHIKVDSANPGATKLTVSCGSLIKNETAEVEFNSTWNTTGCPAGTATVTVLSRDVNDPNWANPSSAIRSYNLSAPPVPVPSPTANFWADATSILQGQCTNLHWDTADATSVDIDGSGVNASGSKQVCPSVTQKFTLTAHAGSGGADAKRNITITVTAVQQPPAVIDSFQTGNVISISGNIYVIVDGRRRHVPNPATLDALGIGQSLINNKGFSDSQLSQIIQGPDIPDVNIDPTGVASFRAAYLPNLTPIVPKPTQAPTNSNTIGLWVAPVSYQADSTVTVSWNNLVPSGTDWISLHPAGAPDSNYLSWQYANGSSGNLTFTTPSQSGVYEFRLFRSSVKVATSNSFTVAPTPVPQVVQPTAKPPVQPTTQPQVAAPTSQPSPEQATSQNSDLPNAASCQNDNRTWLDKLLGVASADASCTDYVNKSSQAIRDCWGNSFPNAGLWDDWARDTSRSGNCGWSVEPANNTGLSNAKSGDIVVWNGFNQNNGQSCSDAYTPGHVAIFINRNSDGTINVNGSGWTGDQSHTKVDSSCMSVIHLNLQPDQAGSPTKDCSQYKWPLNWFCKWGWIK